ERRGNDRFVLEHDPREQFEIQVALWFLEKDRTSPSVLARFYFFKIPIRAFDQSNSESSSARPSPIEQIAQVGFCISEIRLHDNSNVRPVAKFGFAKERREKGEGSIFVRVT